MFEPLQSQIKIKWIIKNVTIILQNIDSQWWLLRIPVVKRAFSQQCITN